jgi:hypothetical protein
VIHAESYWIGALVVFVAAGLLVLIPLVCSPSRWRGLWVLVPPLATALVGVRYIIEVKWSHP